MTWLLVTIGGSSWLLLASIAHVGGAVSQRAATAVMQPLTTDHRLEAVQATALTYLLSVPMYGTLLIAGRRRLNERRLRDAAPHTTTRDRFFSYLLRATRRCSPLSLLLSRLVEAEKRNRWVLTILPFLVSFISANLLAQVYAARLPFSTGNAITTFGPITVALVITWRSGRRGSAPPRRGGGKVLPLFLPLMSAAGAAMMIPWGRHIDGVGVLAALGGAVCAAVMVSSGKEIAYAGISLKGSGLSMVAGLLLGWPSLLTVHWTWEIGVHVAIAALLTVGAAVLYWLSQGPLHLPKRVAGALSANGPALSGLVGLWVLDQAIGLPGLMGITTILVASLLNAGLTGSADERAEETAKYTAKAPGEELKAHDAPAHVSRTGSRSQRGRRRPPIGSAQGRTRKARALPGKRQRRKKP